MWHEVHCGVGFVSLAEVCCRETYMTGRDTWRSEVAFPSAGHARVRKGVWGEIRAASRREAGAVVALACLCGEPA